MSHADVTLDFNRTIVWRQRDWIADCLLGDHDNTCDCYSVARLLVSSVGISPDHFLKHWAANIPPVGWKADRD
jgi:hypothetical protein